MIDHLEILTSKIRGKLSHVTWSARLLGFRSPREPSDEPGLILVQVDGLGEDVLLRVLQEGRMPFLRHLIEDEGHHLHSLYSGFPSSTPAFQGELFYGVAPSVPAFGFLDPEHGRVLSMGDPAGAALIEERLRKRGRGLMEGGSAWSNIWSGGAGEAHLCASTAGLGAALRAIAPHRVLGVILWHFASTIRVLANLVVITAFVTADLVRGRLSLRAFLNELRFVPVQVAVSAIMREVVTTGACVDAERGLPIIQLNYVGYDEHAHRRGPESRLSRWSLKGIDASIRRVWMASHRSRRRDYQVWIYSDHGQEAVVPYQNRHGESVPRAVERVYQTLLEQAATEARETMRRVPRSAALTEHRFRWLGVEPPHWTTKPLRAERGASAPPIDKTPSGVIVVNQGPAGFVYLPGKAEPDLVERMAAALVRDAHIPMVIHRDGPGRAVAHRMEGLAVLPEDASRVFGSDHPYADIVSRDILKVLDTPGSGDLLLVGWNAQEPLTLQDEHGAHGGPGPRETSAFLLLPPEAETLVGGTLPLRPRDLRRMVQELLDLDGAVRAPDTVCPEAHETERGLVVPLRIMTYNVHGCRGMDGKFSPERIARVIARERPHIVCLQELDQERSRSGGVDQVEVIARRLRSEYHFHSVGELDDGRFGNAVLSLLPLRMVQAGPLPSVPRRTKNMFNLEDRGALWVAAEISGKTVHVVNTHLSLLARERRLQADALLGKNWLGGHDFKEPVVLAGDFNAAPHSWTVRRLASALRSTVETHRRDRNLRTWSGRLPLRRIDHIFVSQDVDIRSTHVARTRLSRVASDHMPVVADLEFVFPREAREGENGGDGMPRQDRPVE